MYTPIVKLHCPFGTNPNSFKDILPLLSEKIVKEFESVEMKYRFEKIGHRYYQIYLMDKDEFDKRKREKESEELAKLEEIRIRKLTDENCPYKKLKEAYADGWIDDKDWYYGGEYLTLKGRRLTKNFKEAISKTAWEKLGYVVKPGETPVCERSFHSGKRIVYSVFGEHQVELKIHAKIKKSLFKTFGKIPGAKPFLNPDNEVDLLVFSDWLEDNDYWGKDLVRELAGKWKS